MKRLSRRPLMNRMLWSLVLASLWILPAAGSDQLPPVPKEAQDAYFRAYDIIDVLNKRPDKAAGSPEWDVVVKRLMEAQSIAPTAPLILRDLGLAHELRGRSSAAVAWFKAAWLSIERVDPGSARLGEIAKRIDRLMDMPRNQIELTLTFARGEIPYINAKRLPTSGVENIWPVHATPPLGPVVVQLPNGQWAQNPDLFEKDGTPKLLDVSMGVLEEFLIELRLGIGDTTAIAEAEEHWKAHYAQDSSEGLYRNSDIFEVRRNAYRECARSLVEALDWPDVACLADEAAEWCEGSRYDLGQEGARQFRQLKQEAEESLAQADADKLDRWVALAKDLAKSDDEVYLQAKIDGLRQVTEKGERLLEGIAGAIKPVGRNLMRLRGIPD